MRNKWLVPVISILVIIGAIIGIKAWHTYQTTEIIEEENISISHLAPESIKRIEIRDDKTHIFTKQDSGWLNEKYSELMYNQKTMEKLAQEVAQVTAYKTIRNVQDLSVYGIHEYARMITLYTDADEKVELVIGDYIDNERAYYVWCSEKKVLGLIPEKSLSIATSQVSRWIDHKIELPKKETLSKLQIINEGKLQLELSKGQDTWYMTEPYEGQYMVDEKKFDKYWESIGEITKDAFVAPREGNEEKYGISTPSMVMKANEEVFFQFGKNEDGYTYFTYGENPYIYQTESRKVKELIQTKPFEWLTKNIVAPKVDLMQMVEIKYEGQLYTLEVTEDMLEENKELMQSILDLKFYGPIAQASPEEKNPREAEVTIRYVYKDNTEKIFEFVPYDPSFYLLRHEGVVEFSVEKKLIMDIIKMMKEGVQ